MEEEDKEPRNAGGLWKVRTPAWQSARTQGPQSCTSTEPNMVNLNEFGSRLVPALLIRALHDSFVKTGTEKPVEPAWASNLQNWEKIRLSLKVCGNLLQRQQKSNTHTMTRWWADVIPHYLLLLRNSISHSTSSWTARCTKHFTPLPALLLKL